MDDWSRHVYPHGEFTKLNERLWVVAGSLPRLPFPRNMYVYCLDDGGLLVWSAVAMDEASMQRLEALGPVRLILVPNNFHRMQAQVYFERYPNALVICPAAARAHVAKKVTVHGTAEEVLPQHGVVYHSAAGLKKREGICELPVEGGSALLFCDSLFNLPHGRGVWGVLLRCFRVTGFLGVTPTEKLLVITDTRAYASWLGEQARRADLKVIGVAHGDTVTERCAERLAEAAARI